MLTFLYLQLKAYCIQCSNIIEILNQTLHWVNKCVAHVRCLDEKLWSYGFESMVSKTCLPYICPWMMESPPEHHPPHTDEECALVRSDTQEVA